MQLYYMEEIGDGTVSLYDVKFSDRHKLWKEKPNAKEISRKEYNALKQTLSNPSTNPKLLKQNR